MIHLQDINKTYQGAQPLHVLKGISLDIAKGEFVSIMGASGSGKSTLLNILGILDNYDSGTYELAGVPIWNLSETKAAEYRNKMIGFIFQSFNLISFKTAVENVELPLFYQGVSRKKRHQMAMENQEDGMTIVVVTHESGVANETNKIVHIKDGVIGNIEENLNHDASPFGINGMMK